MDYIIDTERQGRHSEFPVRRLNSGGGDRWGQECVYVYGVRMGYPPPSPPLPQTITNLALAIPTVCKADRIENPRKLLGNKNGWFLLIWTVFETFFYHFFQTKGAP